MARYSVRSEVVQELVEEVLLPLYLQRGSVTAAAKALNEALQATGETRLLHINRVQAMLSDDVSRGVNELTIELTRRAREALLAEGWSRQPPSEARRLEEIAARAEPHLVQDGLDAEELASRLGAPAAVLKAALAGRGPSAPRPTDRAEPAAHAGPDWSYQDTAVARCLDAFRRRPNGNVGLVLPTGAGKTRTAFRVILEMLARASSATAPVIWVTHRRTLKAQAYRELRKLLTESGEALPADALKLAGRVVFAMLSEIETLLAEGEAPVLVVVDEAHHAAAASYLPVFESPHAFPVLLLTATPNRTDRLPIGIDEIAFTITYRELAERGAILIPKFEPVPVEDFDWSPPAIRDLAHRLVDETADRFAKTLVLAPRIDQVRAFYDAFLEALAEEDGHPLSPDDVGYIVGDGNSHGLEAEDFLARFALKPRAVLVSAQMLLEGFDDATIDSVVITYKTESMIKLMQAAGRCVRYAPGKTAAYVLQADNPQLAYRFDHRWLYQEIDDYLRPELADRDYDSLGSLKDQVAGLLDGHNVNPARKDAVLEALEGLGPGDTCRLLLYGLPFYGAPSRFQADARWGAILETPANSTALRGVYNEFSALGAHLSDPTGFLEDAARRYGVPKDLGAHGFWRQLAEMLTACFFAQDELYGAAAPVARGARPFHRHGSTTWLKYITFSHRGALPPALEQFLVGCHNRAAVEQAYLEARASAALVLKAPLPLGGFEAVLLDVPAAAAWQAMLEAVRETLRATPPDSQFQALAALRATRTPPPVPMPFVERQELFLTESGAEALSLRLSPETAPL